ncbi:glycosyltransferase family 2 protein [Plantactinospora sp. BB1]|uniref:glycosyltransferase family 2 protein n=1 Tax=Plantactinospora sp. BB1 TaxID=2071627 RepID=UPI000D16438B|nr:glycosyltransferase family A protein [Plantactinospora sp. BB1]AVT39811.1 glycosyl transferase [Plantactinospora sp. BB1]
MSAAARPGPGGATPRTTTRPLDQGSAVEFRTPRLLDVLVPTRNRPAELAVTLAGLAAQRPAEDGAPAGRYGSDAFGVVVSDQSDGEPGWAGPAAAAMVRVLRHRGHPVLLTRRLPRRGLAEHRSYLLDASAARYVLFLDDDVWLEPGTVDRLLTAIRELDCGFVGNAVHGLSYLDDVRPETHRHYAEWDGPPEPERLYPGTPEWDRAQIHSAANLLHVTEARRLPAGRWRAYKVSWIGGCVLYDRSRLCAAGGFDFWTRLDPGHQGEDVAAQLAVMARYAGAGVLPSGAYHLEAPTTVTERTMEAWEVTAPSDPPPPPAPPAPVRR